MPDYFAADTIYASAAAAAADKPLLLLMMSRFELRRFSLPRY